MKLITFLSALLFISGFALAQDDLKPEMLLVEGGTFRMGNDYSSSSDERPEHKVTLSSFYMSKYEITIAQYNRFCRVTGKKEPKGEPEQAVVNVNWYDAVMYCNWLSTTQNLDKAYSITRDSNRFVVEFDQSANGFRLPTEAEWEYAAKGGNKSKFYAYSGSNVPDEVAWFITNASNKQRPVGEKKPNELGLYDMTGNVMEWCFDWYDENYYQSSPEDNPTGPESGIDKVCRGGNYMCRPDVLRNTKRFYLDPTSEDGLAGIRLVRNQ
jgi:formylglycine-generating enzyme required for sulfatase activity